MLMMRGLRRPRFTQRSADADDARPLWDRCAQRPADADNARASVGPGLHRGRLMGPGLHRGRLMLMMRGLRRPRFTQRPADADDARPSSAQVYTEAG